MAAEQKTQTEESRVASIGEQLAAVKDEIMAAVDEKLGALREGGSAQAAAQRHEERHLNRASDTAEGLEGMVNEALNKALSGRDAAAAEDKHRAQHEQLEAAAAERKPISRSKRHTFMGWGEPAE